MGRVLYYFQMKLWQIQKLEIEMNFGVQLRGPEEMQLYS